ncbi:MAG: DNA cytosine methyltransferase, partial [Bacillota bacterium]
MRFLDLFAGIGGFRLALERAGHTCIGFCEIDEFARRTYKANFDTEGEVEWHDITKVTNSEARELRGKVDLITGGFPCQAFSIAGERRGFEDTRGTLFFEIARIAKEIEPRFLLLENVKGLLSHDKGRTFAIILSTLDELGYDVEWQVLNSKDFGVPQNRERVFIIGHSRRFPRREVFPLYGASPEAELEFVGGIETAERWLDDGKNHSRNFSQGHRVYD